MTGSNDHSLRIWNLKSDSDQSVVLSDKVGEITALSFAPTAARNGKQRRHRTRVGSK